MKMKWKSLRIEVIQKLTRPKLYAFIFTALSHCEAGPVERSCHSGCNPTRTYLGVGTIDYDGTYF